MRSLERFAILATGKYTQITDLCSNVRLPTGNHKGIVEMRLRQSQCHPPRFGDMSERDPALQMDRRAHYIGFDHIKLSGIAQGLRRFQIERMFVMVPMVASPAKRDQIGRTVASAV